MVAAYNGAAWWVRRRAAPPFQGEYNMRKTTIQMPQPIVQAQPVEKKEVIKEEALDHSKLALWIGAFIGMGALGLVVIIAYLWPAARREWPLLVVFVLGAWLIGSAWYGWNWVKVAAVRLWQIEDDERTHRHWMDQQLFEGEEEEEKFDPSALALAGYKLLRAHYKSGKDCTRPECEKMGIDQQTWNRINQVLKLAKIKGERKWIETDYDKALDKWEEVTIYEDATVGVQVAPNSWQRVKLES